MQQVIYADLRCLQDDNYRLRGIGLHVAALFRARRQTALSICKTVGLVDPQLPDLLPEFRPLFDEITYSANPPWNGGSGIFLDPSPMGHDPLFSARFLHHSAFLRAVVVYDFIPFDWPGYLPTTSSRIDYFAKLARLKKFDLLFPISEYTARRAAELVGTSTRRMIVTGASVRRSIYEAQARRTNTSSPWQLPYFFAIYGGDARKNIEIAVKAVRRLNVVHGRRIPLKVAGHYDLKGSGHYDEACKRNLLRLAGHAEGKGFLEFCPLVSDKELVALYSGAIATIVPSHIEGFSLPVVEAAACGCPVVASTCDAHLELIDQPEALFPPDDADALCEKLDNLLSNPSLRDSLRASQARLGPKFHEDAVGMRFWNGIEAAVRNRGPATLTANKKPRLAFLSPYPPERTGPAFYTANVIRAAEEFFEADLYTNAPRPLTLRSHIRDAGKITLAPVLSGRYHSIVSVIGGSRCDPEVFGTFARCGGPCILHDLPPFLGTMIKRASPLIVHSAAQQAKIKQRYDIDAHVLPCCPTKLFSDAELTHRARNAVRQRLGVIPGAFCICSFGTVARDKGMQTCIAAVDLLRSWNIPAEFYFVGDAAAEMQEINRMASLYGVNKHIHVMPGYVEEAAYCHFLIASDAAIQIRSGWLGQISSALMDCISAGLPSVTTAGMAGCCDAPPYISAVPDRFSPLQVAEQLALIWDSRDRRESYRQARRAYLEAHNFRIYAHRLVEILGIA